MAAHTLRYYERIGLVDPIGRRSNGHRRCSNANKAWLKFLHGLRATCLSIREMLRYAALRDRGQAGIEDRRKILEDHRTGLDEEIAMLQKARALLAETIEGFRHIEDPIIAAPFVPTSAWAATECCLGPEAPGPEVAVTDGRYWQPPTCPPDRREDEGRR